MPSAHRRDSLSNCHHNGKLSLLSPQPQWPHVTLVTLSKSVINQSPLASSLSGIEAVTDANHQCMNWMHSNQVNRNIKRREREEKREMINVNNPIILLIIHFFLISDYQILLSWQRRGSLCLVLPTLTSPPATQWLPLCYSVHGAQVSVKAWVSTTRIKYTINIFPRHSATHYHQNMEVNGQSHHRDLCELLKYSVIVSQVAVRYVLTFKGRGTWGPSWSSQDTKDIITFRDADTELQITKAG